MLLKALKNYHAGLKKINFSFKNLIWFFSLVNDDMATKRQMVLQYPLRFSLTPSLLHKHL